MTTHTASKFSIETSESRSGEKNRFFEELNSKETLSSVFEEQHAAELRSRLFKTFVSAFETIGLWLAWLANASITRKIGPGARSLERHEFESVEIRRGGFGNVF